MKNKLFIALDIDGVINSHEDFKMLSQIDNILDNDFYENIFKKTIYHNKGFLNLENHNLKFEINKLENYKNIIKFPFLNSYELNFAYNFNYDLKNFINYEKLIKLKNIINDYLIKNTNNECHVVIISSWFPWDNLKSYEENNLFFKDFLEFDKKINVVGGKITSGVAQYRYETFLEYCKKILIMKM